MTVSRNDSASQTLVGRLVEVSGLAGEIDVDALELRQKAVAPETAGDLSDVFVRNAMAVKLELKASGRRGRAVFYSRAADNLSARYIIETFDGVLLAALETSVKEFVPCPPEEMGGFDVAWPFNPATAQEFAERVCECLEDRDYCVVQMFLDHKVCDEASAAAKMLSNFAPLDPEYQQILLGAEAEASGKTAWLDADLHGQRPSSGPGLYIYDLGELKQSPSDQWEVLSKLDGYFSSFSSLLWPVVPDMTDEDKRFVAWGRSSSLVRVASDNEVEREPMRMATRRILDTDERFVLEDLKDRQRLCLLLVIDGENGELELRSREAADALIPIARGTLVAFRPDRLEYVYRPAGNHVALQSWVLDMPAHMKDDEEALRVLDGYPEPTGERVGVMSAATRYAFRTQGIESFWDMLLTGGDGQVQIPHARWDHDLYYREQHEIGYTYCKHGCMLQLDELECFDNEFFGFEDDDAKNIPPSQRIAAEVGFEALWNAGYSREDLNGLGCGVFIGETTSDWDKIQAPTSTSFYSSKSNNSTCTRISQVLGLTGPAMTAETACSSSLVALGGAVMAMRRLEPSQYTACVDTSLDLATVIGVNVLIGPFSYISLSGPHMLSTRGRCFTFDASADGYARGEGCGGILLKHCRDSVDAMGRLAMLIGSATNQDGRSASMTAPHGPSQQACIRDSMREAGVAPNEVTIAECHGTGTPLGDPIEVGALRGVMGQNRSTAILKTSTKTNIGHMEAGAGMGGLIKCIQMLRHACGGPNNHLKSLNPHLDMEGYACHLQIEAIDLGANSNLTGVSSFGFGGTNARVDVWGEAQKGVRKCITGTIVKTRSLFL
jgi:polyketide synthase-associated protein